MPRNRQQRIMWILGLPALLGLSSGQAWAAGFALRAQSASNLGTAGAADTAGTQDISAIFSNPAAIGLFSGQRFSLGVASVMLNTKFKDGARTVPVIGTAASSETKTEVSGFSKNGYAPALYGTHQVSDSVNLGWSFTAPLSTNSDYGKDWVGRYHGIKTELQVLSLDLGGSYKILKNLHVGGGLQIQHGKGSLSGASNLGALSSLKAGNDAKAALTAAGQGNTSLLTGLTGTAKTFADNYRQALAAGKTTEEASAALTQAVATAAATGDGKADVIAAYDGEGIGYGINFGVLYSPIEDLNIGVSYRSKVKHQTKGDILFSGESASASAYVDSQGYDKEGKLDLTVPDVISLGASYKPIADLTLFANVTQTRWSSLDSLDLRYTTSQGSQRILAKLDWKDALYMGLGGSYQLNSHFLVRAGVARDNTPTSDNLRSPRSPDNDRTLIALGGGYQGEGWQVDAGLSHTTVKDPTLNLKESDYPEAVGRGNLSGKYEVSANTLMVQYGYQL
jgi:long-chain fatty acid transport protein